MVRSASSLRSIAAAGALLVALGLVLAGGGWAYNAYVESASINCVYSHNSNCASPSQAAQNGSILSAYLLGVGTILAGIGFAVFAVAVVEAMHRRSMGTPAPLPPGT
jgi:hypothetical protein